MFVGWPGDPRTRQSTLCSREIGIKAYRGGSLSGLGGDLGLRGGWEMYRQCISLQENRKNTQKTGELSHIPAI